MTATMEYTDFLKEKVHFGHEFGVEPGPVHPVLKPHQRDIVEWAVRGGRRAIFASFGLGKSIMQLETLRLTLAVAGGRGLIVCPLGVKQEFVHDALELLGMTITFVRRSDEIEADGIYITNYESVRDGKIDVNLFTVVVRAMRAGRRGRAAELNTSYFLDGVKYCEAEERRHNISSLFDLDEEAS